MAIQYYERTLRLISNVKILLKKFLMVSYTFFRQIDAFGNFANSEPQITSLSLLPKEILEDWNGSSSNIMLIRWTPCAKTVAWHLEKTCIKCQALEWLIFDV